MSITVTMRTEISLQGIANMTATLAKYDVVLGSKAAEYNERMSAGSRWTDELTARWSERLADKICEIADARRAAGLPGIVYVRDAAPLAIAPASVTKGIEDIEDAEAALAERENAEDAAATAAPAALPMGIYWLDGSLYRVRISRTTGQPYAQLAHVNSGKVSFTYAPGVVRSIRITGRLTGEEVAAFGVRTGQCLCCGRELTAKESIEAGIGPICRARYC